MFISGCMVHDPVRTLPPEKVGRIFLAGISGYFRTFLLGIFHNIILSRANNLNPVWVTFGSNGKVTEFSIGKSSENAKNPAEIGRFQPDLVGVSGFEPEASWSRRLVGYF